MSKGERIRGQRAIESLVLNRFRNYSGKPGPNNADHVCLIDHEAKSTEVCRVCRTWWEPMPEGGWAKMNRWQRRERSKALRKAWTRASQAGDR